MTWRAHMGKLASGLVAIVHLASVATGQPLLGAGSLREQGWSVSERTHAWLVAGDSRGGAMVYHIPPRVGASTAPGGLRPAAEILVMPRSIGAVGAKLYMAFEPPAPRTAQETAGEVRPRTVLVVQAVPLADGRWGNAPAGRLEVAPSLNGAGTLVGLAGTDAGLISARLEGDALIIERLEGDGWNCVHTESPVPGEVQVFGASGGIGVLSRHEGRTRVGYLPLSAPTAEPSSRIVWCEAPGGGEWRAMGCTGQVVLWQSRHTDGSIVLYSQGVPRGGWRDWRLLSTLDACAGERVGLALDDDAKVVLACRDGEDERMPGRVRLREVSVSSGRVLFDGPARLESPVRIRDVVVLMAMLIILVGSIVVFVWAPAEQAITFPEHAAMAEPARRFVASTIDLLLGLGSTVLVMGVDVSEVFSLAWWGSGDGYVAALTTLGGLVVACSLLECLTGRTPGKLLTGCAVVSVKPWSDSREWRKPTFGQALIRNLIKWGLPPVGMMALLEADGRARADQHARTAVVVRIEGKTEESDE